MKKITTLFKKNSNDLNRVIDEVDESNKWVLSCGIATRKYDGTACAIINGELYKRYDAKKGRSIPVGAIPCQDADAITGHYPHWIKVVDKDKYHLEGLANKVSTLQEGTYELVGPKVQSNPDMFDRHMLILHGSNVITDLEDHTFNSIKQYLSCNAIEGIVFYHSTFGDNRMCKIRRKDFGLDWPFVVTS